MTLEQEIKEKTDKALKELLKIELVAFRGEIQKELEMFNGYEIYNDNTRAEDVHEGFRIGGEKAILLINKVIGEEK